MRGNRIENCPDLDITQKEIAFQEAEKRENIKSNEKVPVIFGKISRWFTDLGSHLEDKFIHVTENEREKWDKATQVSFSQNLTTGTRVGTISIDGKEYDLYCETNTDTNTDTKNTAGSTNSNSKLFLVGAAAQTENSKTYSRDSAYIGTDGCLYSNNAKTLTVGDISQSEAVTLAGRKVLDAVEKNAAVPGTLAHQVQQVNSKLATAWADATTTDNVVDGAVQWHQWGLMCEIIVAVSISTPEAWKELKIATNLPPSRFGIGARGIIQSQETGLAYCIKVTSNGELFVRTDAHPQSGWYRGAITYITTG